MSFFCYLLECVDGSYYCGWTNDLNKRVNAHASGRGGRYTRAHLPVRLVYFEECESRSDAMRRETILKARTHDQKRKLAAEFDLKNE